jgi:hypothetical protein
MSDLDFSNPYDPDELQDEKQPSEPKPFKALSSADEIAAAPPAFHRPLPERAATPPAPVPPAAPEAAEETATDRPAPWKAAASSVPRLRQQPAPLPEPVSDEAEFQGFTQDAISGADYGDGAAKGSGAESGPRSPLSAELPLWEAWLERARALPRPVLIGTAAGVLVVAALFAFLLPHGAASIPLARIRQHPEAYDGRVVKVEGRAGETFSVGSNFVFDLQQGRDTIVVYSRTRRPSLHERVEATGTVSIGYLDGAPRLALFEEPQTP